ncbi:MAG TPA: ScpA family protein [Candidatus Paceibacterota bacterium]|nr:ScpA family protein [Candidatus Paceibacterota bacterium]
MSEKFSLETPVFQGPLEALLDLIEARKMSVSEVSLTEVCDAYLAYVEKLPELPLGETAQFILVASTLLLIKSRTLLPTLELSQDERESVEELERRLARYAIIRKAAKLLRKEWGNAPLVLARRAPARPATFSPAETSIPGIKAAVLRIIQSFPRAEEFAKASIKPILALEDVVKDLHARLRSTIRTRWSELARNTGDRHELIVHFLAVLELVRNGSASVTQDRLFSDITIELENVSETPSYGI